MKRILLLFALVLVAGTGTLSAQRCLPGQMEVELTGGTVDGFLLRDNHLAYRGFGRLALSRYGRNLKRWAFGVAYLQKDYAYKSINLPKAQFSVDAGYFLPLLSSRGRSFILSAGLSAVAGYETTN